MILSAIAAKLKQRSKANFKARHFEAAPIVQAVYRALNKHSNLVDFLLTVLRTPAHAAFSHPLQPLPRPRPDQLTFELGQTSEERDHEPIV